MARLEDLRARLMKPAKDLADWNFPLAETLDEYHSLLKEEQDVNLNKDSLVLQNTANTHVRRIEYLFQDTTALFQTFVDQEAANESKKDEKEKGKTKKTVIEIINFEPINFTEFIGKNINTKNRNGVVNTVKLLGQRFPQLENISQNSNEINSNEDAQDHEQDHEDTGKKYAFRCNQYITTSGMLVEQLTPFEDISQIAYPGQTLNDLTVLPDGAVDLNVGEENHEFSTEIEPALDHERCIVSTPMPDDERNFMDTSFGSAPDSGRGSSLRTTIRPESSLSIDPEINRNSPPSRPCSSLFNDDLNNIAESTNFTDLRNDEAAAAAASETSASKRCADEQENNADFSDTNAQNPKESETIIAQQRRRSKRLRSIFDTDKYSNTNQLEPIPFDSVPDELPKSRTEFKLPCHISLLKFKERPRKRKITSEARKRRCLEKFLLNENAMGNKKMTLYSPTRELFMPYMKEELKALPDFIEKHLRNRQKLADLDYEAVTNTSMDLLGYKLNDLKPDSLNYEISTPSKIVTTTLIPESGILESPSEDTMDDFPMPDTPESSNSPEPITPNTPTLTYSGRIEQSVRDIYESADVRTEQEEAVIRWHEKIQPKLRELRRKPTFEMAEYTSRVIRSLKGDESHKMTFDTMVRQYRPTEAARYLLASLQLANTYNLRIDTSDDEANIMLVLLKEDNARQ